MVKIDIRNCRHKREQWCFKSILWSINQCYKKLQQTIKGLCALECPELECPELECPKLECPELECPELECSELECPELEFPELECPELECPEELHIFF